MRNAVKVACDLLTVIRMPAAAAVAAQPGPSVRVQVGQPYRNMKEYLADHPDVFDAAVEGVRRAGVDPKLTFVRARTEGSQLTQLGLRAQNLFTGQQGIHALNECVSVSPTSARPSP